MTIGAYGNSFKLALEESGFSVNTTADGERAIALIRAERPAALVLDLTLPRADGFGVAEAMRAQCGDVVPIVVVTVDHGAREKADAVGAVGHPGKPFDLDELTQLITRALEGA